MGAPPNVDIEGLKKSNEALKAENELLKQQMEELKKVAASQTTASVVGKATGPSSSAGNVIPNNNSNNAANH